MQIIVTLDIRQARNLQSFFQPTGKSDGMDHDIKMGEGDVILERRLYVIKMSEYRRFNPALAFPVPSFCLVTLSAGKDLGKHIHIFVRYLRERFGIRADGKAASQ